MPYIEKLSKWEWMGGHRAVYCRGDHNRTAYVEVRRSTASWELLSHPHGCHLAGGRALTVDAAKSQATKALKIFLAKPRRDQLDIITHAEEREAQDAHNDAHLARML